MATRLQVHSQGSRRRVAWRALAALALAASVQAGEVFKCRTPAGGIVYQDRQCATEDATLVAPMLPRTYRSPAVAPPPSQSTPAQPAAQVPLTRLSVEDALPQMFRCTTPEGTSYVDSNPTPRGRYVPLWTLALGSTGPGLASGTLDPRYGSQYTYVEDRCRAMPRGELCGWWKQRADETGSERRRAFNDRRPALDQEYAGAQDALARFCR